MTVLENRDLEDVPCIPEYYREKTVFITGGTGFLGKVLIEKLLYSCTDLKRIYLLLRNKNGTEPEDRLASLYDFKCFDRLRTEKPGLFEAKVSVISGDCSEIGLGMSDEDRSLIVNQTNIVFHSAASVRFDDPLKKATNLNLRGTREMLELATNMPHLESFIHVSTSYANTNRDPVEEVLYPPFASWRDHLDICENIDDHTLQIMTQKYLGEMPNTYAFTKQLAEHMVYEHKGKLPIVIMRPSIVISSDSEPMPGWIDNFNGPIGLSIAIGKGVLRTVYCDVSIILDYIPVDLVIKSMIVASWMRGTRKLEPSDDIPIYNSCDSQTKNKTLDEYINIGLELCDSVKFNDVLRAPAIFPTTSKLMFVVNIWLFHLLPAIFLDILLWIFGKKTILVKIIRRIYTANHAIQYYITQQWLFSNKNFIALRSKIKDEDKNAFYYDIDTLNIHEFYRNAFIGAKKYLLKEKEEDIPKASAHYRRLKFLDKVLKCAFYGLLLWWGVKTVSGYISFSYGV